MSKLVIQDHKSSSYGPRTYVNASSADVTVALAVDYTTAGERLTHKAAGERYLALPLSEDYIPSARILWLQMYKNKCSSINVAGNGIYTLSKHGWTQEKVNRIVHDIIDKVGQHLVISKIVCGGQTGVDLAGAVAAYKLGIDCVVTMPKGFKMRFENGKDYDHSEEFVRGLIVDYACML